MSDLDAALAFAKATGSADTSRGGVVGFCWGGRQVWLYAARNSSLKAAVAWYGPLFWRLQQPTAVAREERDPPDVVGDLKAPVLGLYGGEDPYIPTVQIDEMKAKLAATGGPSKIIAYPGADRRIIATARATEVGRRLLEVPGIGPVWASAFVASVADPAIFKSGRDLAAWMGLCRERTQVAARSAWAASPKPVRLSAADADGRRHGGDPLRPAQQYTRALARAASGPPPNEGCGYRARQQDRPNRVGADEYRRTLSRSPGQAGGRIGNAVEIRRGCGCADEVGKGWEGQTGVNATSRLKPPDQENPYRPSTSSASLWSGPDTRMALWPAALCAAQTGRTHGRTNQRCRGTQKPLPKEGRPHRVERTHRSSPEPPLLAQPTPSTLDRFPPHRSRSSHPLDRRESASVAPARAH